MTTDLDVLPVAEESNLARLGAAMTELGARLRVSGLSDEEAKALPVQLADGGVFHSAQITNWRTDAGDLDVMLSMPDHDGVRRTYEEVDGPTTRRATGTVGYRDVERSCGRRACRAPRTSGRGAAPARPSVPST